MQFPFPHGRMERYESLRLSKFRGRVSLLAALSGLAGGLGIWFAPTMPTLYMGCGILVVGAVYYRYQNYLDYQPANSNAATILRLYDQPKVDAFLDALDLAKQPLRRIEARRLERFAQGKELC